MTKAEITTSIERLAKETEDLKEGIRKYYANHTNGWESDEIKSAAVGLVQIAKAAEVAENYMRNIMYEYQLKGRKESVIMR